ncbi:MAG TPA: alpha-amylase/4-alpha-glucanotransferase domain-containing protein [Terriglobia bacterium]|nr:alpha-amylase/4-alpha-glucanotransferase domain-containing protein [Terriglobia bacterium]
MNKISLALVVHAHQPVGNFDHVFEDAYQKAYRPFVQTLLRHPRIRMGLHFSGCLLEWIEKHHPEYFQMLKDLAATGQAELMGGGHYEPILSSIPDADKALQIARLSDYLGEHFGARPQGAWLTERVWRQDLVRPLAEARIRYVLLDDTHFIAAGVEPACLHGTYLTEELGVPLQLVPSLKKLRYTIPFRDVGETIDLLRQGVGQTTFLFAAGDDAEKFGIWPGTHELCYTRSWLEHFFQAIEDAGDWLETTTLARFMAAHKPLGRVYLPTASYPEMMEWALPPRACQEFLQCLEETGHIPSGERFRKFLLGGTWQGFLGKYPESNQIHKLMLEVSRRLHGAEADISLGSERRGMLDQAQTHLLAAQCNDAYWHGLFGGLYSPHLRSAVLHNLVRSEALLDQLNGEAGTNDVRVSQADFDLDGEPEIMLSHAKAGMILKPSDGGTVSSLRFKPAATELINSLMRRPEVYHSRIQSSVEDHPESLDGKRPDLAQLLRYDRYMRHCFRTYLFPRWKQWQDFERLDFQEESDLAAGAWQVSTGPSVNPVELFRQTRYERDGANLEIEARKILFAKSTGAGFHIECRSLISANQAPAAPLSLGVEMVFNLLAPDAPDRYFEAEGVRHPLQFSSEIQAPDLKIVDEWQGVALALAARPECRWWIAPIRTVSQSEAGFETVYQGSAIMAVWEMDLSPSPESRWIAIEISRT